MGKSRRGGKDKEWDRLQQLTDENKRLRQQVTKLRNVVKNIDTSHYRFVQDLLESELFDQDNRAEKKQLQQKLESKWGCHECGKGVMRLVILHRAGEPFYLRRCDHCDNKTKLKPHTPDVEGI